MHIKKIKLDNLKHPMRLSSTPNHPYMICYVISTGLVEWAKTIALRINSSCKETNVLAPKLKNKIIIIFHDNKFISDK